jgi:hypothetical protein
LARHYYSTQPFIAWCLNHYFYNQIHFAWVGAPFYPYRMANPRSSSPLRIYEDFYEPWKDEDEFSGTLIAARMGLRKGVIAHQAVLPPSNIRFLKKVCNRIHPVFFYPLVYRVDLDRIDPARQVVANSGLRGSQEYRIADLDESIPEFELLFVDFETENVPHSFADLYSGALSQADVLNIFTYWLI